MLESYITPNQASHNYSTESHYLRYREDSKDANRSSLIIPPDNFVQYIERMDEIFRCFFKRQHLCCKVADLIYKEITTKTSFIAPCQCFPIVYLKKLF